MNKQTLQIVIVYLLLIIPFKSDSTIIIPPANFGDMISNTEYIVYGEVISKSLGDRTTNEFRVLNLLKGNLERETIIDIEEYSFKSGDLFAKVMGDVNFEVGKRYLLFLWKTDHGSFKTSLMALSVYEEGMKDNETILAHPYQMQQECFVGSLDHELSGAYEKQLMLDQIESIVSKTKVWNKFEAGFIDAPGPIKPNVGNLYKTKDYKSTCPNTPPSHCTTLIGSVSNLDNNCNISNGVFSPGKFANSNFTVKIASGAQNDPSTANEIFNLTNAINSLNGLPGISVVAASPLVQTCSVPQSSCNVSSLANGCNTNINEFWVFFDDPCNEINDLVGCSGVLGFGGAMASTPCHTDPCGNQWLSNGKPYFVMNNGAGCLSDYSYTATLIHEMMHGIGLGHIGSGMACTAIMNPTVCNGNDPNAPNYGITTLDEQCIEWMYNIGNASTSCSDGIQNGMETGVDCGGPCPACPTCNDGIQNGMETGVDCGGSCSACPTCTDGIQNGDEAGIDCGGSFCPLCDCTEDNNLTYSTTIPDGTDEYVNNWIKTQGTVKIDNGSIVNLRAGSFIELLPGFEINIVNSGSVLIEIEQCDPQN